MNQPYYPPNGQPNFGPPPAGAPQQQPNFGPPAGAPQGYPQQQPNYAPPASAPQGYPQQQPSYGPPAGAPQGYPQMQPQQPNFAPPAGAPQGYPQQPPAGYPSAGFNPQAQVQANPNPFFSLNGADPTGSSNLPFLEEGLYHLRFNKILTRQSRKGKLLYIMELMVLKSTNPSRPAGTLCSAFINLSHEDTRDRSLKQLVAARWGSDPQLEQHKGPVAPDGRDWVTNVTDSLLPTQPWAGVEIGCHVHVVQKKDGDDFSRHDFMPVSMVLPLIDQALAQQAARGYPPPQAAPQYGAPPAQYAPPAQQYAPQGLPPAQGPAQYAPQGAPYAQPPAFAPMPGAGAPQGPPPQGQPPQGQPPQGQPAQPGWPNWGR